MDFREPIADEAELRSLAPEPGEIAREKELVRLDEHCRAFIARSPFVLLATSGADGSCDVSPRGGPAGFVRVLDDRRLAIGDLPGNRRFDSLSNLLANPRVGLLFMVPRYGETLRVNGRACLTRDPELLAELALRGRTPKLAVGVTVEQAFLHCAKALKRSQLWEPEAWPELDGLAPAAAIWRDHVKLETPVEELDGLERGYAETLY